MKPSTLSLIAALLAAITGASPAPERTSPRQEFTVSLTFYGAAGRYYFLEIPTDDTLHHITHQLSVSQISSNGGGACSSFGVNGSDVFLPDAGTVSVGPPQRKKSVVCDIA